MVRTATISTEQHPDNQSRDDSSLSLSSGVHPQSSREILLSQLKTALEHFKPELEKIQLGQDPGLPVSESVLLRRSISSARSAIVQATRNGFIHGTEIAQSPAIDLSSFNIEHFVIDAFNKSSTRKMGLVSGRSSQDATFVQRDENSIIAVLSDGVSRAPLSGYGAALIAETITNSISSRLGDLHTPLFEANFLASVYIDLYKEIHHLATEIGLHPVQACDYCFAATFHVVVVTPHETIIFGLGDGHLRAGGEWEELIGRTDKGNSLSRYNIPPLLSSAIIGDFGLTAQRSEMFKHASQLDRNSQHAMADTVRQNASMVNGYHEEALSFRIYRYQATAETLETGLTLTSDGLKHTSLSSPGNQREVAFPHEALVNPARAGHLADLMNLWNIATDDSRCNEMMNIRTRLQRVHELYSQNIISEGDLTNAVVERAIINSDGSYTLALNSLSAAEVIEYSACEISQLIDIESDLLLLSRSLKQEAIEALRACLPDAGISNDVHLVPLRDDFSQISLKRRH